MQEADTPPEPADPLQQDALAVFGGLGPQDGGGHLPQLLAAAVQPHPGSAQQSNDHGQGQHPRLEGIGQLLGEVIQAGIGSPEHPGDEPGAEEKAKDAADQAGRAGIDDVFQADKPFVIAHGFPHAHLGTLLVHHTGHGGDADQGGHQEEEHREHHGNLLDDGGILLKGGVAHILAPGQDIDGGLFDIVQLLLRLIQVGIGLGNLLLGLGKGGVDLVQQLPVIAHVFFRGEAHAAHKIPHLLPGVFLLAGDLRLGVRQLLPALRDLLPVVQHQLLIPKPGLFLRQGGDGILGAFDLPVIGFGIGGLAVPEGEEQLFIIVRGKAVPQQIDAGGHMAVA